MKSINDDKLLKIAEKIKKNSLSISDVFSDVENAFHSTTSEELSEEHKSAFLNSLSNVDTLVVSELEPLFGQVTQAAFEVYDTGNEELIQYSISEFDSFINELILGLQKHQYVISNILQGKGA